MKALNLRSLQKKVSKQKQQNNARLEDAREKLDTLKAKDYRLTALDLLLESILDGTPGLSGQLETALRDLEQVNKEGGY